MRRPSPHHRKTDQLEGFRQVKNRRYRSLISFSGHGLNSCSEQLYRRCRLRCPIPSGVRCHEDARGRSDEANPCSQCTLESDHCGLASQEARQKGAHKRCVPSPGRCTSAGHTKKNCFAPFVCEFALKDFIIAVIFFDVSVTMNPKGRERVLGPALQEGIPWVKETRKVRVFQERNVPTSHVLKKGRLSKR